MFLIVKVLFVNVKSIVLTQLIINTSDICLYILEFSLYDFV